MEAAVAQIHPAVAELRPGRRFEGRYACLAKERLTARNGSSYLSLRLRDRSGTIGARVFRDADRIGLRFEAGDAVAVRGRVERYRGELTAELDDVRRLDPGTFDPGEFLPAAYRSVEELEGFLEHLIREVHDPALRGVVDVGGRLGRRSPPSSGAPRPLAAATTPTSGVCSSTRSPSARWSARSASCTPGSTPIC